MPRYESDDLTPPGYGHGAMRPAPRDTFSARPRSSSTASPANPGTFNSYELHVEPHVPGEPNDYFLNSRTGGDQTFVVRLDYAATIAVPGAGTIQFRSFDSNCRQITNCSTNECGPVGPKPVVTASVMNAEPPPPPTFTQPFQTGANEGRGQWVYIDVTDVVARP